MKLRIIATVVAAAALALPAGASAAKGKDTKVTVMTRNVYLGADLSPVIEAADLQGAVNGAGEIYNEVARTNFPERAVPLAQEIIDSKADLVGLQEVALWREQRPSDLGAPPLNPDGQPATDVTYDFLQLLTDQLGSTYRVVGAQEEFDAEFPANTDGDESTGNLFGADLDARLTMRDVILARKGVKTKKRRRGHYDRLFEVEVSGVTFEALRGWLSTMATVRGASFKFVNTHLEAFGSPKIRQAQAKQLIKDALKGKGQVVLVGDLNSGLKRPHRVKGKDQLAYKALEKFGMVDRGAVQSCCYPPALDDPGFVFDHTVDHVLVKPKLKSRDSYVTGNDPGQMTPSGLWPSDHGGVVSTLLIP